LTILLPSFDLLPTPEALLVGYTLAFVMRYFIPSKPRMGGRRMLWQIALVIGFYLTCVKAPLVLKQVINFYLAYGIPIAVFLICFVAWLGYSTKLFPPRRA